MPPGVNPPPPAPRPGVVNLPTPPACAIDSKIGAPTTLSGYQGSAKIRSKEGQAEVDVVVSYAITTDGGGLMGWHGSAYPESARDLGTLLNDRETVLVLPDGRMGSIRITSLTIGSAGMRGSLQFAGNGPAPD